MDEKQHDDEHKQQHHLINIADSCTHSHDSHRHHANYRCVSISSALKLSEASAANQRDKTSYQRQACNAMHEAIRLNHEQRQRVHELLHNIESYCSRTAYLSVLQAQTHALTAQPPIQLSVACRRRSVHILFSEAAVSGIKSLMRVFKKNKQNDGTA